MNEAKTDDPNVWVKEADDDLRAAKTLLRKDVFLLRAVCFHAQQCGEKYFKALLLHKQVDFPKIHDLNVLNILCERAGILTGFDKDMLDTLSEHAVRTRYPGLPPTEDDARESIAIAKTIRKFARKWLGIK
jgi:HEPN domain-containing protein